MNETWTRTFSRRRWWFNDPIRTKRELNEESFFNSFNRQETAIDDVKIFKTSMDLLQFNPTLENLLIFTSLLVIVIMAIALIAYWLKFFRIRP